MTRRVSGRVDGPSHVVSDIHIHIHHDDDDMRLWFLLAVGAQFLFWHAAAYAVPHHVYHSSTRVFPLHLAAALPAFAGEMWMLLAFPRVFRKSDAPWHRHVGAQGGWNVCVCISMLLGVLVSLYFAWIADQAWPGGALQSSPCGRSSCSAVQGQTLMADGAPLVYNPRGFYVDHGKEYTDHVDTTCVFSDCRWSGISSEPIRGRVPREDVPGTPSADVCFSPSSSPPTTTRCLATDDPADYPDLGTGVQGGFFAGLGIATVDREAYCPGIRVPPGGAPVGGKVCAYCGPWEAKWLGIPLPEGCPQRLPMDDGAAVRAEDNFLVCMWMCPAPFEDRTRRAAYDTLVLAVMANPGSFALLWIVLEVVARIEQFAETRERRPLAERTVMDGAEYPITPS